MINKHLFFQISRCTGCQLCVMACSLVNNGSCGKSDSFLSIHTHPEFGTSIPILDIDCFTTPCSGECTQVCSPGCLKLSDEQLSTNLHLNPNWQPVPFKESRNE